MGARYDEKIYLEQKGGRTVVKAIADVYRETDPKSGVYTIYPAVIEEFVDKNPMILRKRMDTLPPLMVVHKKRKDGLYCCL